MSALDRPSMDLGITDYDVDDTQAIGGHVVRFKFIRKSDIKNPDRVVDVGNGYAADIMRRVRHAELEEVRLNNTRKRKPWNPKMHRGVSYRAVVRQKIESYMDTLVAQDKDKDRYQNEVNKNVIYDLFPADKQVFHLLWLVGTDRPPCRSNDILNKEENPRFKKEVQFPFSSIDQRVKLGNKYKPKIEHVRVRKPSFENLHEGINIRSISLDPENSKVTHEFAKRDETRRTLFQKSQKKDQVYNLPTPLTLAISSINESKSFITPATMNTIDLISETISVTRARGTDSSRQLIPILRNTRAGHGRPQQATPTGKDQALVLNHIGLNSNHMQSRPAYKASFISKVTNEFTNRLVSNSQATIHLDSLETTKKAMPNILTVDRKSVIAGSQSIEKLPVLRPVEYRPQLESKFTALDLLNLMNGFIVNSSAEVAENGAKPYKVYIGEGNNRTLVRKSYEERHRILVDTFVRRSNLVWTQLTVKDLATLPLKNFDKSAVVKKVPLEQVISAIETDLKIKVTPQSLTNELISSGLISSADTSLIEDAFDRCLKLESIYSLECSQITLPNHMAGSIYLSRKVMLAQTLQAYCQLHALDISDLTPVTYLARGDTLDDDLAKIIEQKSKNKGFDIPLILKPGEFSNCGIGIAMAYDEEQLKDKSKRLIESRKKTSWMVIQEYIDKPMLFKGRKFDIRCYALITKFKDSLMFYWYNDCYARTSSFDYSVSDKDNLKVHLTNEAVQVKGSVYLFDRLEEIRSP